MKLEVFDPAMCCSTGVCGPGVDPDLARFAADLSWLSGQGVEVERFNLAQQPQAFVASEPAKTALQEHGDQALPLLVLDGKPVARGTYPSRDELATMTITGLAPKLTVVGEGSGSSCGCSGGSC